MHQISGSPGNRRGSATDPARGAYSALPDPLAGFRGRAPEKGTGKGVERGQREAERRGRGTSSWFQGG